MALGKRESPYFVRSQAAGAKKVPEGKTNEMYDRHLTHIDDTLAEISRIDPEVPQATLDEIRERHMRFWRTTIDEIGEHS